MLSKVHMKITRTLHPVIFKMSLIHIAGVLQTAPNDGVLGTYTVCSITL